LSQARNQSTDLLVVLLGEKAYQWGLRSKYRKLNKQLATLRFIVKDIIRKRSTEVKDSKGTLEKYTDIYEALHLLRSQDQKTIQKL